MTLSLALILALAANVFFWLSIQSLFPALPLYISALGGTPTDNGLSTFVAAGMAVLARVFIGTLADRAGRKPVMLIGGITAAAAPVLYLASQTVPAVLASRVMAGVAIAAFSTGFQALLADLAAPERRGEAFGWGGNSLALSALVGPLAGAWITTRWGFTVVFNLAALSGALCTLATLLIREPPRHIEREIKGRPPLQGLQEALAQRNVRAAAAAITPLGIAYGATITFWPLVAQEGGLSTSGSFYTVYALGLLAVQILAGRLSDRIGRSRVMLPGMLLAGAAFAAIPHARTDATSLMVALACGAGLGIARTAMDALVLDGVPAALRGTAVAIEFTMNDLWIGLGSVLLGPVAGAVGYGAVYGASGAACVALAAVWAAISRPRTT
jgi:MFS family permease